MLPFVITYGGRVAGQLDISNIVHGVLRSCTVGYWWTSPWPGVEFDHGPCSSYRPLLHHGWPASRRSRHPSGECSESSSRGEAGLRREAYYERFLDIAGGWRDHIGFAITVEEVRGMSMIARLPRLPPPP